MAVVVVAVAVVAVAAGVAVAGVGAAAADSSVIWLKLTQQQTFRPARLLAVS